MDLHFAPSELILNDDGSIYHLHLRPEQLAGTIITVGDPGRVEMVSEHFDQVEHRARKREFVTHTGTYKGKRLTVISTGIGPDNIDIVFNELDALANINLETRRLKDKMTRLNFVRLGTSGTIQAGIPVDAFVATSFALGLDGLMHYYRFEAGEQEAAICNALPDLGSPARPYIAAASDVLLNSVAGDLVQGITVTCPGFYAPQGRQLRARAKTTDFHSRLRSFQFGEHKITNIEMETSAIYGFGRLLGHNCLSLSVILANRATGEFSPNPKRAVENLIETALDRIAQL